MSVPLPSAYSKRSILFLWISCLLFAVEGKKFTRCGLAKELEHQGFSRDDLPTWVCLVESESGRNTSAVAGPNRNGSYDHGLFQINDRLWCNVGEVPGKGCNITCDALETDDITESVKCARHIYEVEGLKAWFGWQKKCKNKELPDLNPCFS